jgi:hypothetical protein
VTTAHYAESFTVVPGRCFRLITRPGHDDPDHCPAAVVWHGRFKDRAGKRHEVDACDVDAGDLEACQAVSPAGVDSASEDW